MGIGELALSEAGSGDVAWACETAATSDTGGMPGPRRRRGSRSNRTATVPKIMRSSGLRRSRTQRSACAAYVRARVSRSAHDTSRCGTASSVAVPLGASFSAICAAMEPGGASRPPEAERGRRRRGRNTKGRRASTTVSRKRCRAQSERGRQVLRSDHLNLGIILDDGLDGVVQYTGDSHIHGFLFGHDVTGITVLDVTLKDAGRCGV